MDGAFCLGLCVSCNETRVARFRLDVLLGDFQIHFHPLIEVAVGDVTERFAVSFGQSCRALFNEFDVQFRVEFGVETRLFMFLLGIKRIAMIGMSIEMWENLVENFPIYAPAEKLLANVCNELSDIFHNLLWLAVNEIHHVVCWVSANCQREIDGNSGRNLGIL